MGVDPGDKRIGIAISDETGTIANPHQVLNHISRTENARRIVEIVSEINVVGIVIGQTLTDEGEVTFQGRKSARLEEAIHMISDVPVYLWNEDFSTNAAQESRRAMGIKQKTGRAILMPLLPPLFCRDIWIPKPGKLQSKSRGTHYE